MKSPSNLLKEKIAKVAAVVVILMSAIVAIYALFLLVIGQPWVTVSEGNADQQVMFVRAYPAIIPFLAATTIVIGVVVRKQTILWIGNLVLFTFSVLFVFGIGGAILPIASITLLSTVLLILSNTHG